MRLEDLKGRRVGRYEILEVLGRGGMAAVYRARDTVLRRDVALKILYPQYTGDVALVERFQREAVLAASLDHPNILPIYDVGDEDGLVYIAMRLLSGRSFADTLRLRGALPIDELLPIADQVAAALDYAHARQIVHRDIKPANILIEELGDGGWELAQGAPAAHVRAILTDFGIAKSLDSAASGITATGVLIGTPEYMAPEQIRGGNSVDARADIYALGVLVYRALTGRRPFEGSTEEVLMGHLHGSVAAPSALDRSIPLAIDGVIRRVLARDPAQRYPSAGEFARALRSAAGMEPPTPPPALRRAGDGRVVVPSVALGGIGGSQAPTVAQTTRQAAPPARRPAPQAPPARAERGNGLAWMLLGLLLALVVGGGTLYAVGLLGNGRASGLPSAPPTAAPTEQPAPTSLAGVATDEPTAAPTAAPTIAPTNGPTAAPTAAPTVAPSNAPTAVPTVAPTKAPTVAPTPRPTVAPTITPTPSCPIAVGDEFMALLEAQPALREALGCATQARQPRDLAEQPFQRGAMLWVQGPQGGNGLIYVIEGAPKASTAGTWESYEDTWQAGDPEDSGDETPPEGLLEPIRGFGRVWYSNPALAEALGWASAAERAGTGAMQRFPNARLVFNPIGFGDGPAIYALYENGAFEVYAGQ